MFEQKNVSGISFPINFATRINKTMSSEGYIKIFVNKFHLRAYQRSIIKYASFESSKFSLINKR